MLGVDAGCDVDVAVGTAQAMRRGQEERAERALREEPPIAVQRPDVGPQEHDVGAPRRRTRAGPRRSWRRRGWSGTASRPGPRRRSPRAGTSGWRAGDRARTRAGSRGGSPESRSRTRAARCPGRRWGAGLEPGGLDGRRRTELGIPGREGQERRAQLVDEHGAQGSLDADPALPAMPCGQDRPHQEGVGVGREGSRVVRAHLVEEGLLRTSRVLPSDAGLDAADVALCARADAGHDHSVTDALAPSSSGGLAAAERLGGAGLERAQLVRDQGLDVRVVPPLLEVRNRDQAVEDGLVALADAGDLGVRMTLEGHHRVQGHEAVGSQRVQPLLDRLPPHEARIASGAGELVEMLFGERDGGLAVGEPLLLERAERPLPVLAGLLEALHEHAAVLEARVEALAEERHEWRAASPMRLSHPPCTQGEQPELSSGAGVPLKKS